MESSPDQIHEPVGESCTAIVLEERLWKILEDNPTNVILLIVCEVMKQRIPVHVFSLCLAKC